MKVLTLKYGETESETTEIHMLNVGEVFEGFGGTRHPLVAGRDYTTGEKHKKPTASIVTRRRGVMGVEDKELDIFSPSFWEWIARLINDNREGEVVAEPAKVTGG
jgi:hypothetical protein